MTTSQYAGLRANQCTPTVIVNTGGNLTDSSFGTYYVYIQGRNRAGHTLFSTAVPVTVDTAGQQIEVTLPADCRRPGEDLHRIFVLLNLGSDTPFNASVVAAYETLGTDQETLQPLPTTIILDEDEHLLQNAIVTTSANLPAAPLRINGMRREVTDLGYIVEFLSATSLWVRVEPNEFGTLITNTSNQDGANVDVRDITDESVVIKTGYSAAGGTGIPVKFWIKNDGVDAITAGTPIGVTFELNGEDVSDNFVGLMQIRFLGFADSATGLLDTTGEGGSGTMAGVGVIIDYQNRRSNLILQKNLPAGSAYFFEIIPNFEAAALAGRIAQGASIKAFPFFYQRFANYTPLGILSGDFIAPDGKLRRLFPDTGLLMEAGAGSGLVGSYAFVNVPAQVVAGAISGVDNQLALISGNGDVWIDSSITAAPALTAIRARIGTIAGIGDASAFKVSDPINLGNTALLDITVNHPTAIRANYPDVIAGSTCGTFNANQVHMYFQAVTGGNILRAEAAVVPGQTQQTYQIGLGAITDTGATAPPAPTTSDFGLYSYTDSVFDIATSSGASNFPTDSNTYYVAIAPNYLGTVTRITHEGADIIDEVTTNLIDAIQRTTYWAEPVEGGPLDLRPLTEEEIARYQSRQVVSGGVSVIWYFDPLETAADNGIDIIKPDHLAPLDAGRWKPVDADAFQGATVTDLVSTVSSPMVMNFQNSLVSDAGGGTALIVSGAQRTSQSITMTDNVFLNRTMPEYLFLNPDGNTTLSVILGAATTPGLHFNIQSVAGSATEQIPLREFATSAPFATLVNATDALTVVDIVDDSSGTWRARGF